MTSPKFDREVAGAGVLRSSSGALSLLRGVALAPCPYERHRASDWRRAGGGPVTCGVCHPPAPGVTAVPVEAMA